MSHRNITGTASKCYHKTVAAKIISDSSKESQSTSKLSSDEKKNVSHENVFAFLELYVFSQKTQFNRKGFWTYKTAMAPLIGLLY